MPFAITVRNAPASSPPELCASWISASIPACRSANAVAAPATPPPTMTTVMNPMMPFPVSGRVTG